MAAHMIPIKTAIIVFIIVVYMIFIPWLILHYRKYRYFSLWHTTVIFSFIFYSIAALFLVTLPLPQTRDTCALQSPDTVHYVLQPFNSLLAIKELNIQWSNLHSIVSSLREQAFLQPFFNVLLLFPLGIYLRYFWRDRSAWWKALLTVFSVSLFFEITQLTGIYGLYNCPYRLFDVDDLMFNTVGGIVGFFLAPIVLALFPSKEDVLKKAKQFEHRVTPMTQLLAIVIDLFVVQMASRIVFFVIPLDSSLFFSIQMITYFTCFVIVPIIWNRKTIGSAILRFNYQTNTFNRASAGQMVKRFLAIYAVEAVMWIGRFVTSIEPQMDSPLYVYEVLVTLAIFIIVVFMWLILIVHLLHVLFKKGERQFYFDHVAKIHPGREDDESTH